MTDTFNYRVITETAGSGTFTANKAQFGDGYSQTLPRGLNSEIQTWSPVFAGYANEAAEVLAFIREHEGRSFFWTPPLGVQGYYQCLTYTIAHNSADHYSLRMEFVQSYAPLPE